MTLENLLSYVPVFGAAVAAFLAGYAYYVTLWRFPMPSLTLGAMHCVAIGLGLAVGAMGFAPLSADFGLWGAVGLLAAASVIGFILPITSHYAWFALSDLFDRGTHGIGD